MSMVDIKHRFVTARGVRHHVAETGVGPPLVQLHGWPEFWATWEPIFARLANRYRLIAPDFRGSGESENPHPQPTDTVNAASLAEDIVALPDAMDIDRCGFVGHDVGSNVVQVLGVRSPKRVTGLFFFNCATHGVGNRWNELPTRVLWGRHDPILKSDWADVLDQYFAEIEVSFAEDAGHLVYYECPELAARGIDRFFSGLAQRQT